MGDSELVLGRVPVDVMTAKKPDSSVAVKSDIDNKQKIQSLYKHKDVKSLVKERNNPEAQLAATVLMASDFRFCQQNLEVMTEIDLTAVACSLGLDKEAEELMRTKRNELISEDINQAQTETVKTLEEVQVLYKEMMLPVRTAILNSEDVSEDYKTKVIQGIDFKNGPLLEPEGQLLKDYYPKASRKEKNVVMKTVASHMRQNNIDSFDIVPIRDWSEEKVMNENRIFALVWNNPKITSEVVETKMAEILFPGEDSEKVSKCWEILQKITLPEKKSVMSVEIFKSFVDNAEELLPVVEMLSNYGFNYQLINPEMYDWVNSEYIEQLKELGKELPELKQQLDAIREILPEYKFKIRINLEIAQMDNNPCSLALEHACYSNRDIKTQQDLNRYIQIFNSLVTVTSEKWRPGLVTTYVDNMIAINNHNSNLKLGLAAMTEVNKWVFDSSLTAKNIVTFGRDFFEASLQAKNGNTKILYEFCKQNADQIHLRSRADEFNKDQIWREFISTTSDIYRYLLTIDDREKVIEKSQEDLIYASEAVFHISDPQIEDQAISHLIHALTDEELGDVKKAQLYVDMMQEGSLKQEAQTEVSLELERSNRGESTAWKKMEKLKRTATKNELALQQSLGYQSEKRIEQLKEEINRIEKDFCVTVNITWKSLLKALEQGRMVSVWENQEKIEERQSSYTRRRDEIERMLGIRAKGGNLDPHPIYGAASAPNSKDEFYGGAGGGYGECFVKLKSQNIARRTLFCFGDSCDNTYNKWLLDWEGGITAKAMLNLKELDKAIRFPYVEASILGGVSLDDIESINIPSNATTQENKKGWYAETQDIEADLERLKQRFPGIKINIIEVPEK